MIIELNDEEFEEMITLYVAQKFSDGPIVNWTDIQEDEAGNQRVRFEVLEDES